MKRTLIAACGLLLACSSDEPAPDTADPPDAGTDTATTDTGLDTTTEPDTGDPVDTSDTSDTGDPPTDPEPRGPCSLETRLGAIVVESGAQFSFVQAEVADGVIPATILEPIGEAGDCRLLRRNNPFCNPPCQPGFTCDFDGQCIDFPEPQDIGTVTVNGLLAEVSMEPVEGSNTYFATGLPHPPFDEGAKITATTTAGFAGALSLVGRGGAPLELKTQTWSIVAGQDLVLEWSAGAADAGTEIGARLVIDQHGNSPVALLCTFADTGSGAVPAALIDQLLGAGVSGFPNGTLRRQTLDSVDTGAGCVELLVSLPREPEDVAVAGHTPCQKTDDCPAGQTCNVPLETCE